jgi:hypothetical protein
MEEEVVNTRTWYGGGRPRKVFRNARPREGDNGWESGCSRTATGAVVALAKPLIRHGTSDLAPQRRVSPRGRAHLHIAINSSPGLSLLLPMRVSRHGFLPIDGCSGVIDATGLAESVKQHVRPMGRTCIGMQWMQANLVTRPNVLQVSVGRRPVDPGPELRAGLTQRLGCFRCCNLWLPYQKIERWVPASS